MEVQHGFTTPSHDLLHSFCVRPAVTFQSQHANEEVIVLVRKHPITQLNWIINTIFLFILLIAADFFLPTFFNTQQLIFINIAWGVLMFTYAWANILSWIYNVGILTNRRVVDIDFHNMLYKEITATIFPKVSDVTSKVGGFFGSMFQFGDVFVKTEGAEQNIEFDDIPHPTKLVHIINHLMSGS